MLPYIYGLTSLAILVTIIRKRNPVTFISLYGLGTIIYGIPLFLGFTVFLVSAQPKISIYYSDLDWRVYAMFFAAQAIFFIASFGQRQRTPRRMSSPDSLMIAAMNVVLVFCFFMFLKALGPDALSLSKSERLSRISVFYYITSILAQSFFIFYVLSERRLSRRHLILPAIFVVIDLVIGFRSMFLAATAVAVAYSEAANLSLTAKSKVKVAALGLLVVVAGFMYKPLQGALTGGYFDLGRSNDYLAASFIGSEPFASAGVLNEVVRNTPTLPEGYAFKSLIQFVPFYMEITNNDWHKFNDACQTLFPEARWGVASTSFGELYCIGGWLAIVIFLLAQLVCLWSRPPGRPYLAAAYYYLGPYLFIYFYRNDWTYVLGAARQCALTAGMVAAVYLVLRALQHARAGVALRAEASTQ